MTNKERAAVAALCVAVGFLAASPLLISCDKQGKPSASGKEFVCYDDGKLVERHVGVKDATIYGQGNIWYIYYVDSDETSYYNQPMGETCFVEVVVE